mgnify:CR=1 FL=1
MANEDKILLEINNLRKYFPVKGMKGPGVQAVQDVSFFIKKGETLGLVGESGCGKTTLGRTIIRLHEPTGGKIVYDGETIYDNPLGPDGKPLGKEKAVNMLPYRRKMQIVFQDPYSSLNPKKTIRSILSEGYLIHHTVSKKDLNDVLALLSEKTGISKDMWDQYPHELDGGKRQVVGIARALSMNPKFIVCDEPVSSLDVSVQAKVLNLLMDLQKEMNLSYLFISHDLSLVRRLCSRVIVMKDGRIVEQGAMEDIFENPQQEYTQKLIAAIPRCVKKNSGRSAKTEEAHG